MQEYSCILFSIDQVAMLTGVAKSTLYHWEKTFQKYFRPTRICLKKREYSFNELKTIKLIKKYLKEEHLTNLAVEERLELQGVYKIKHKYNK